MNTTDKRGDTPLLAAAEAGCERVVDLLLRTEGIQANKSDVQGFSPLYMAAVRGHVGVVERLLQHGDINVNKATKFGITPLRIAAMERHHELVNILKERLRRRTIRRGENATCIVCLDRRPSVVLVPCGHQNLCGRCARKWNKEQRRCPVDRTKISEILALIKGI